MPVEEDDGKGGRRRTNPAKHSKRGIPQGAPIPPLLSNVYMRRFVLGWKVLGHAVRLRAHIVNYADDFVNYADDFVILCRGTANQATTAMRQSSTLLRGLVRSAGHLDGSDGGHCRWMRSRNPDLRRRLEAVSKGGMAGAVATISVH